MHLPQEQKDFYRDNGYLAVENVIPLDVIAGVKERFDWLCRHWDSPEAQRVNLSHEAGVTAEKRTAKTVRKFQHLWPHEPIFRSHALHANLLNVAADLIGTPMSLYDDLALLKPPSVGSAKPAHQDNAYFKVEPPGAVITCWCAIDDATLDNGCMRYIPRSHKHGLIGHKHIEGTTHLVPEGFDPEQAVPVPLRAGGVVCHHSLTLHFSLENSTPNWRRSYICHYIRDDADLSKGGVPASWLLHVRD
jgi:ectoine hydroxylase-related dioxygenase (phytanoyl-CoA dioxygenase family)